MKAEITPSARVIPKLLIGGNGESRLAKKAKTVVITDKVRAMRKLDRDLIHASAGELVSLRAFSYDLCK